MASFFSYHLIFIISLVLTFTYVNAEDPWWSFCNDNKKINSTRISSNIDHILPNLVSHTSVQGYTFLSSGSGNDRVYGLAQCRGDVLNTKECSKCIEKASIQIQKTCPNQADARILYEFCFLRYDTQKFVGELDTSGGLIYFNVENVTEDSAVFEKILGDLTDKATREALDRRNPIGFGKGQIKLSPFETLYTLVQCTRDLSKLACSQCLATAVGNYAGYCKDKKGCRAIYSSCFIRYELYPIFYPVSSVNTTGQNVYSRHLLYP
ncbi:hypothetical protein C5167_025046 [Papaver somniferum]|uniref:Gnk2-homologous domain-containing protein n=1 Tax=Papaver somniferum TaxID=3469 RepID=A0A4Y7JU42_PAPSO|nr:cysteine-rich repeat secretory protein 55-like [Papaver somniferum]RZC63289.1 hypothetical protein C5167_025046 [Papaver somniferum]